MPVTADGNDDDRPGSSRVNKRVRAEFEGQHDGHDEDCQQSEADEAQ